MVASVTDQHVLRSLIASKLPEVSAALDRFQVDTLLITTQWFLTLFVNTAPTETVLRIWDVVFAEGSKVLFRVALALFKLNGPALIAAEEFDTAFRVLKRMPIKQLDADELLECAFNDIGSFPMRKITSLRAKHLPIIIEKHNETRRLREQHRLKREANSNKSSARTSPALSVKSTPSTGDA